MRKDGSVAPKKKYETYACTAGIARSGGGFHVSISQEHLDWIVSEVVVGRLCRPDFLEALAGGDKGQDEVRATLRVERANLRECLESVRAYAAEHRQMELLVDQEGRLKPNIKEAGWWLTELSAADPQVVRLTRADDVRAAWEGLDLEWRSQVVRVLMVPSVKPRTRPGRRGPDPGRVDISWL